VIVDMDDEVGGAGTMRVLVSADGRERMEDVTDEEALREYQGPGPRATHRDTHGFEDVGEGCVVVWEALEALKETDEALEVVVDAELLVKVEDGVEADEGAADEDGF